MEIKLYDQKGKKISDVSAPSVFNIDGSSQQQEGKKSARKRNLTHLLYEVSRAYLINRRSGTASTKTRGEVDGGSKKPWRQKHTGNARAGSIRSPLWRKGGIIFGPKPKEWRIEIPRAKKRLALAAAIAEKIKEGTLVIIEKFDIGVEKPKTKVVAGLLKNIGAPLGNKPVVLADVKIDPNFQLASRNIPNLDYKISADLNAYEVLRASFVIITREAFDMLALRLNKGISSDSHEKKDADKQ